MLDTVLHPRNRDRVLKCFPVILLECMPKRQAQGSTQTINDTFILERVNIEKYNRRRKD